MEFELGPVIGLLFVAISFLALKRESTLQCPQGYADGITHSHITGEDIASERAHWQASFDGPGAENNYEPTVLYIHRAQSYNSSVDIYWREDAVDDNNVAQTECINWESEPANICDQFLVTFAHGPGLYSPHHRNNIVCHEVGHTIGFNDPSPTVGIGSSCLTDGNNADLKQWETTQINGWNW